jgi:hypothetical protein
MGFTRREQSSSREHELGIRCLVQQCEIRRFRSGGREATKTYLSYSFQELFTLDMTSLRLAAEARKPMLYSTGACDGARLFFPYRYARKAEHPSKK